jgi:hypothetical protein
MIPNGARARAHVSRRPPGRGGAAEDAGRTGIGVDVDAAHRREVDDQPVVDAAEPGSVVPAAAHGDFQPLLATEEDSCSDIGRVHRV